MRSQLRRRLSAGLAAILLTGVVLMIPTPAGAAIHEIIGAGCRTGGFDNEVVPPGQLKPGGSFLRALQATGVIESIVSAPAG